MHLPDGILPSVEWAPLGAVAITVFATASARARRTIDTRRVPVIGFLAAVVLVLQLVNFPLVGGASAHLVGTTLLVFVGGLETAAIAMASVLVLQALLFQDGGLLALGANYVNMVVVPALIAAGFLALARAFGSSARSTAVCAGIAGWTGSVAGALACAAQLAAAGVAPMRVTLPWMGGCHALVGLVEGVLTAVAVAAMARRDRLTVVTLASGPERPHARGWFVPVLALGALAAVLVPLASQRPDTLETLLEHAGARAH